MLFIGDATFYCGTSWFPLDLGSTRLSTFKVVHVHHRPSIFLLLLFSSLLSVLVLQSLRNKQDSPAIKIPNLCEYNTHKKSPYPLWSHCILSCQLYQLSSKLPWKASMPRPWGCLPAVPTWVPKYLAAGQQRMELPGYLFRLQLFKTNKNPLSRSPITSRTLTIRPPYCPELRDRS